MLDPPGGPHCRFGLRRAARGWRRAVAGDSHFRQAHGLACRRPGRGVLPGRWLNGEDKHGSPPDVRRAARGGAPTMEESPMTDPGFAAHIPRQMQHLPRDPDGRPVPWWVPTIDGRPDYRAVSRAKVAAALRDRLCWACGWTLGPRVAFLFAGGTLLSRQSTEPPSHEACATYAAQVCPFLVARPDGAPATVAVWVTRAVEVFPDDSGTPILRAAEASAVTWWHAGQPATRQEAQGALDAGHATLRALTDAPGTIEHLERRYDEAVRWLPGPDVAP